MKQAASFDLALARRAYDGVRQMVRAPHDDLRLFLLAYGAGFLFFSALIA
jgi:hypothetical protein